MRALLGFLLAISLLAPPALATVTTLNPSDKAADATLSGGNLTITTSPSAYSSARSTTSHTGGKYVFEFAFDSLGGTSAIAVGVASGTASLTTIPGGGVAFDGISYTKFQDQVDSGSGSACCTGLFGSVTTGSVFMVAVNLTTHDIWIKGPGGLWNGDAAANPVTGTRGLNSATYFNTNLTTLLSGAVFAMVSVFNSSQGTANFGATAFTNTIPTGFVSWDGGASPACSLAVTGSGPC